ncbi:Rho GTPase-activating protein 20 [Pteropus alecto]|uniref:Rho GTPase-activating protein 20 n=1 Tax=Pteropus alecto TaxID=9402 RepID=L5K3S0_PTEAL|nr:Rho GTPase-activating protein 20 [Pteropus alecto]
MANSNDSVMTATVSGTVLGIGVNQNKVSQLIQFIIENYHRIFGEEITSLLGEISEKCDTEEDTSDFQMELDVDHRDHEDIQVELDVHHLEHEDIQMECYLHHSKPEDIQMELVLDYLKHEDFQME